ncbi:hypothetical protein KIH27_09755 [Mycobacterium sp. M1]|uniref:Uncharacterized protein n=1 Tax=Mycolicibacter acidiphilus TaxID=2835306 RepID=A0ABS5RHU5_9MYCO|nr:hypothetical protein [Mycolicibacter acidiphilus]MBS9533868.1 hypothetical protein [Mycolicibacter acidiphilus]
MAKKQPKKSTRVSGWITSSPLQEMDVVYPTRPGDDNDELCLSIRSLIHFPHRGLWVTGHKPGWLAECGHIPDIGGATKEARLYNSVLAAANHPDVSEKFVLFNDDFFVTAPMTTLPTWYLKPLRAHCEEPQIQNGLAADWGESMLYTLELLESLGVKRPLSYELHYPMIFDKKKLAEIMTPYVGDHPPQLRSLYGNLAGIGGTRRMDAKAHGVVNQQRPIITPLMSTNDDSIAEYRDRLHRMFPDPSRYEAGFIERVQQLQAAVVPPQAYRR